MKKFIKTVVGTLLVCAIIVPNSICKADTLENANQINKSNNIIYNLPQNEVRYYQVPHKGALGIPITYSLSESQAGDIRKYTVNPEYTQSINGNKVEVVISGVNVTGENNDFSSILKDNKFVNDIKSTKIDNNKVKIEIEALNNSNIKINLVKRRYSSLGEVNYEFRTFIDVTFEDNVANDSKIIVLDPGHGGSELGATDNFTYEKALNLDVTTRVKTNLEKEGYQVYMTREDDKYVGLLDRTDPANLLNADLFFCIHNNSLPLDVNMQSVYMFRGTTVLYNSTAPKPGKEFANILLREVSNSINTNTCPLQDRTALTVLSSAWCPAVLMETTVESDDSDTKMMMHRIYSQKIADASLKAVNKYFHQNN